VRMSHDLHMGYLPIGRLQGGESLLRVRALSLMKNHALSPRRVFLVACHVETELALSLGDNKTKLCLFSCNRQTLVMRERLPKPLEDQVFS
jgi:hypothetical protein